MAQVHTMQHKTPRRFEWLGTVVLLISATAAGDRTVYGGKRDLEAAAGDMIVRHHHDWSRVSGTVDDGSLKTT